MTSATLRENVTSPGGTTAAALGVLMGDGGFQSLLTRFPILVWAGAALLGWVAGEMIVDDPAVVARVGAEELRGFGPALAVAGLLIVLAGGWGLRRWQSPGYCH